MAFAVSGGSLRAIQKPRKGPSYDVRIAPDLTLTYAEIYKRQPEVRIVVDFLARNIGQLALHTFQRQGENDRSRLRDHPLARLLGRPSSEATQFRLFRALVSDLGIYSQAYWAKIGTTELQRLIPSMVTPGGESWMGIDHFEVKGDKGKIEIPRDRVVYFRGYNPVDERTGLSPIESLRRTLAESFEAGRMREQILRNGARVNGYLTRPAGQDWPEHARTRFKDGWRSQYVGGTASEAGGTPVLEDGMQFVPASQTAVDLQYIESRKLTREEVAAAYFIPPPMVGILDNATFSNIQEQHKMLYQDTLGPWLTEIKQEIELQLLPEFGDREGVYVEFNLAEKLRGSFEEQAAQLQTSVGAPYMTRNEARGRANLPAVDGGDELVVPLNVLVGGQASPTDSGSQNRRNAPHRGSKGDVWPAHGHVWSTADDCVVCGQVKSNADARCPVLYELGPNSKAAPRSFKSNDDDHIEHVAVTENVLKRFFERQRAAVLSRLGAKAGEDWWDGTRWDDELAADLFRVAARTATEIGKDQAEALGFVRGDYDEDRTLEFLLAVAKSRAGAINSTTKDRIDAALAAPEPDVPHVFDEAVSARTSSGATALVAALAGFAVMEAAKQLVGVRATKTWIVTSTNPRAAHSSMAGETVPLEENFSNGAKWPGDPVLGADGVAGCMCALQIDY